MVTDGCTQTTVLALSHEQVCREKLWSFPFCYIGYSLALLAFLVTRCGVGRGQLKGGFSTPQQCSEPAGCPAVPFIPTSTWRARQLPRLRAPSTACPGAGAQEAPGRGQDVPGPQSQRGDGHVAWGRWSFRKDGTGRQELAGDLRGCMGIAKKMDLAWRTAQLGTGGCGKGDRMKVKVR